MLVNIPLVDKVGSRSFGRREKKKRGRGHPAALRGPSAQPRRPACAATHPDPAPPRPTPARPGRIRAASSGRRRSAGPPQALPPPAPPAVPAAPEARESAVTAQVPAAALALQVGAAPRPGAPGSRGRLASAALRPSVPPPVGPGQLAAPRPTWTGPWQRRLLQAPEPGGPAGPAFLDGPGPPVRAFGPGSCRGDADNTSGSAFVSAGAACSAELRGLRENWGGGGGPQGAPRGSQVQ